MICPEIRENIFIQNTHLRTRRTRLSVNNRRNFFFFFFNARIEVQYSDIIMNNVHNTVIIIVMKSEWLNCLKITLVTSVLSRINLISGGENGSLEKKIVDAHTHSRNTHTHNIYTYI